MAIAAASLALTMPGLAAVAGAAEAVRTDAPQNADSTAQPRPVRQPRLSDWLLQRKAQSDDYPLGVSWRVPQEVPAQTLLKLELVTALSGGEPDVKAEAGAMKRLKDWLAGLPATGRVPVVNADGRWLQVNPAHDPVLGPGHTLVMPRRPRSVTVLKSDGTRCTVVHGAGQEAGAYMQACAGRGAAGADWAWIAQPDGRVQRFGIAAWNREKQDEPAAGAWIWAPARGSGWPEGFSDRLIRFLATQGPAPDAGRDGAESTTIGAATPEEPADEVRGTTSSPVEGLQLSGGMSLGLSDPFAAGPGSAPAPSRAPAPAPEPLIVTAEGRAARSRNAQVSSSDWGSVGLLQTPTARMRDAGHLSFHYSRVQPYSHGNVIFQPFDWLEAGFR
ncbi:MAG: putative protein of unknown function rane lipoprotein, partial [Lacunisphaera sp.]|nr:putative protein of unknown function rane lipoprotein [Lacunisphaera sp.]